MKKEAILHIPLSQYAYAEDEHTLVIRLRTAKNDMAGCTLVYGDRVDQNKNMRLKKLDMRCAATDDLFDYYEAVIKDKYTRVCYYFELRDRLDVTNCLYYCERSITEKITDNRTELFQFPYIRREDIIHIPDWAKDVVMYHIFPDSFANGRRQISGIGAKNGKCITNNGGTLKGVCENLDYIRGLGVNCIYLNPIFKANSYHKYDTIDYFEIDPCLGSKDDLKYLVKKCHEMGIRVLLDGVFNHCGPDFFAFRDVMEKGSSSEYYDWFYCMPEPIEYKDPPSYEAFAYVKEMPKLNTGNADLQKYLIDVGVYWIKEFDIDGWRLDVANEINHDFWRGFKKAVKQVKTDAIMIGEIWEDAGAWLMGDQFDSTMNYRFSYLCIDFFARNTLTVSEFDAQIHRMIMRYPRAVSLVQMNFLDSHDVPRFLSWCGGNRARMKLGFFYLIMGYGVPSVFYGDECYIEGIEEPDYRQKMPWLKEDNAYELFKEWIAIRNRHSAVRNGDYVTLLTRDAEGIYTFARVNDEDEVIVVINNSGEDYVFDSDDLDEICRRLETWSGKSHGLDMPERIDGYGYIVIERFY